LRGGWRKDAKLEALQMIKSFFCWLLLSFAAAGASAAEEVGAEDRRAVRTVIEAQLKAFAANDAAAAYSYASPGIRTQFKDAATFMEMVRSSYPMMIGPTGTSFFVPEWGAGVILQGVQIRDREGRYWRALYEMQRQPDLRWRINGCIIIEDDDATRT